MEVILEIARKDAAYTSRETDRIKSVVDLYKHSGLGGGGGVRFYIGHIGMCSPIKESSMVFAPFGSENECRLYPFWSGIGYGFRGNYGSV